MAWATDSASMHIQSSSLQQTMCARVYTRTECVHTHARSVSGYTSNMSEPEGGTQEDPEHGDIEIGVREARARLSELIDEVENRNKRFYITRHKKRVAAIVDPNVASIAVPQIAIPGNTAEAMRIITFCRAEGEAFRNMNTLEQLRSTPQGDVVGGILTFTMWFQARISDVVKDGLLQMGDGEERTESSLPEMLIDRTIRQVRDSGPLKAIISPSVMSVLAGGLWVLQFGMSPARWRNLIPLPLSGNETGAWIFAAAGFADLVDIICGEGTAEELMYMAEDNPDLA